MNVILKKTIEVVIFILLQTLIFKDTLFANIFCFVYIGFILFLPFEINKALLLIFSFFLGLLIDIFYNSLGVHAATCVLWAYLYSVSMPFLNNKYESKQRFLLPDRNSAEYAAYSFGFIFLHHLIFFFIETETISLFFRIILQAFGSAAITFMVILIIYQFFYKRSKIKRL